MAGPRVRGNLRVDRVTDTLRLQQREQIITASTTAVALTAGSPYETIVVGTPAQTINLPQVSSGIDEAGIGTEFRITNNATGAVTIQLNDGSSVGTGATLNSTRTAIVFCTALGTVPGTLANGTWKVVILDAASTASRTDPDVFTFDATTSWGTAAAGEYTFMIDPGTGTGQHSKSPNPQVSVFSDADDPNQQALIETIIVPATAVSPLVANRIQIKVNEVPDGRFAGRIEVF